MAKIEYQIYPDCPAATEESRASAYLTMLLGTLGFVGGLGAIIYYIYGTYTLFSKHQFNHFGSALLLLLVSASLIWLAFVYTIISKRRINVLLIQHQMMAGPPEQYVAQNQTIERLYKESRASIKSFSIKYIFFFLSGLLCSVCLIGLISGIYFLCHDRPGVHYIIGCILGLGILISCAYLLYKRLFHTARKSQPQRENIQPQGIHYCHICGAKLPAGSKECSVCRTKL